MANLVLSQATFSMFLSLVEEHLQFVKRLGVDLNAVVRPVPLRQRRRRGRARLSAFACAAVCHRSDRRSARATEHIRDGRDRRPAPCNGINRDAAHKLRSGAEDIFAMAPHAIALIVPGPATNCADGKDAAQSQGEIATTLYRRRPKPSDASLGDFGGARPNSDNA